MYNNLTKQDILDIVKTINVGNHYKRKLNKINDEKKLRKEFSKILIKYDKFLKNKKYINKISRHRNKLRKKIKKSKFQKGGGLSYPELKNELTNILEELDNINIKDSYLEKINNIENMISKIKNKRINLESKEKLLKEQEERLTKLRNEVSKIKEKQDITNITSIESSDMNPEAIRKLKTEKSRIENELNLMKQSYRDLDESTKSSLQEQEQKYLQEMQEEKGKYEEALRSLRLQKNEVEQQLKDMESKLSKLGEKRRSLENQLNIANTLDKPQLQLLEADLNKCKNNYQTLFTKYQDNLVLKTQLDDAKRNLEVSENKLENADGELKLIQDEKFRLENELAELKKQINNQEEFEDNSILSDEEKNVSDEFKDISKDDDDVIGEMEKDDITPGLPIEPDLATARLGNEVPSDLATEEDKELLKELDQKPKSDEEINKEVNELMKQLDEKEKEYEMIKKIETQKIEEMDLEEPQDQEEAKPNKDGYSQLFDLQDIQDDDDDVIEIPRPKEEKKQTIEVIEPEDQIEEKPNKDGYIQLQDQKENVDKEVEEIDKNKISTIKSLFNGFSSLFNISSGYKKVEDDEESDFSIPIEDDKDNAQIGGSIKKILKKKYYGGTSVNEIKNEINYKLSEIEQIKLPNLNFVKQIMKDFQYHKQKYDNLTNISRKNITEKLPKGVIILYVRLIEDIMDKWEKLGWGKFAPEDFSDIDFEKLENRDEQEHIKLDRKLKEFKKLYNKPKFESSEIDREILDKLEYIYENYYLLLRKWFRKLLKMSKKIRADQTFNIINASKKIKLEFNQFDKLRDILDEYQILIRKPVSVYARINDIGRDESGFQNSKEMCIDKEKFPCNKIISSDYVMFGIYNDKNLENYLNLNIDQCVNIQKLKNSKPDIFDKFSRFSRIDNATKFDEIFFSAEFSNNNTISRYMLLDKLISNGIGIFLVTYGYSGVGKSFTLFGTDKTGGLLQSTIQNMKNIKKTKMRIFEIYGKSLPYSDGYNNLSDIDQQLIYYNLKIYNSGAKGLKLALKDNETSETNDINSYIKNNTGFINFPDRPQDLKTTLSSISNLVEDIENIRKKSTPRRVKPTVNNPNSSRSILIYEFVFTVKLENGIEKDVSFVIDDMPGLEDPIKTYVTENNKKIIFQSGGDFDYFYECVGQTKQIEKIREDTKVKNISESNIKNYLEKNYFIKELQYLQYPIQHYQELLLMSCLLNPTYIPILKPNDIFNVFNQKFSDDFRNMVLNKFSDTDKFTINDDKTFQMENNSKMINSLLNLQNNPTVKINAKQHDKELIISSVKLMRNIIDVCIKTKNMDPLIELVSQILFDEKIPSNPLLKEDVKLSEQDEKDIYKRFERSILSNFIIEWLGSKQGVRFLQIDDKRVDKLKKYKNKLKRYVIENNNKGFFKLIKIVQKQTPGNKKKKNQITSIDQIIDKMLRFNIKKPTNSIRTYNDYVKNILKNDKNIKDSYLKVKEIMLYEKKKEIVYKDEKQMKQIVKSFVNIAFEAWYINQNIAGILKYYSLISDIDSNIIDSYIPKQNISETSLKENMNKALSHLDNLFDSSGNLMNLEINYYKIFCEIKNNTNSKALFQTKSQEENKELIVKDIIDPYVEGPDPKISDFKMFYVLQNNNTQLKCLDQAELFLNTRKFINQIGKK